MHEDRALVRQGYADGHDGPNEVDDSTEVDVRCGSGQRCGVG